MTVQTTKANGIEIAYETFGDAGGRPLLLVMGLGTQMLAWNDDFCRLLADRGFFVVRFDNRDVGLSTHLHDAPPPDLIAAFGGDTSSASYTLDDMADDAAGLLDALGIERAHVVGASLGGMIAQTLAVRRADRVLSLTSIMSTCSPHIGGATQEALAVLLAPPATDRASAVERALTVYRVIASPGYPLDEQWLTQVAGLAYDRGYDPAGITRQLLANFASGDRTQALRSLSVPTLVLHGEQDPLVQVDGGRATAEAIPGAELVTYPGMGHNLPRDLWPDIVDRITALADRAEG